MFLDGLRIRTTEYANVYCLENTRDVLTRKKKK